MEESTISPRQISPHRCMGGNGPQNWKFYAISEQKRPTVAYRLGNFREISSICRRLHVGLCIKIWADSLNGLLSFVGLNFGGAFFPKFSAPHSGKQYVGCKHIFEVQEWYGPPLSPCQAWSGSDFAQKVMFFVSLFVRHAFEWQFVNATLPSICKQSLEGDGL